jgi:hypothetical protein
LDCPEQCPLCDQQPETINHLLTSCVFARQFWAGLLQPLGLLQLVPQPWDEGFEEWWSASSCMVQVELKKGFNTLVMLGVWVIWKHRNACIFDDAAPSVMAALLVAKEETPMAEARGISLL